jgi:hypothetical protein
LYGVKAEQERLGIAIDDDDDDDEEAAKKSEK